MSPCLLPRYGASDDVGGRGGEDGGDPPSHDEVKLLSDVSLSNKKINEAGEFLARGDQSLDNPVRKQMFIDVTRWRSVHEYALRIVTKKLRKRVKALGMSAIVVGRTKRMASIISKLSRRPDLKLTAMQDVCGCRAVMENMDDVNMLVVHLKEKLARQLNDGNDAPCDDYIENPKSDGYRSVHFVVRFKPQEEELRPRKIEIQVRSMLQHRWATAVETVDLFTGQTIKIGGGDPRWRRFFALTASLFAAKENRPLVPGTPSDLNDLKSEIRMLERELHVGHRLRSWSEVMHDVLTNTMFSHKSFRDSPTVRYLVQLDVESRTTSVTVFDFADLKLAVDSYRAAEQENEKFPTHSAVLVAASSIGEVRQAYPGFYGDTKAFLEEVGIQ